MKWMMLTVRVGIPDDTPIDASGDQRLICEAIRTFLDVPVLNVDGIYLFPEHSDPPAPPDRPAPLPDPVVPSP